MVGITSGFCLEGGMPVENWRYNFLTRVGEGRRYLRGLTWEMGWSVMEQWDGCKFILIGTPQDQ
jgi:hypothetical protein